MKIAFVSHPGFGVLPPIGSVEIGTREMARRLAGDGLEIVEQWDEPDYVSVKCRDPDGHIVEFAWETT